MKKRTIFVLISCLLGTATISIFAQEYKNYDLNKYYTPDIVRRGLDLNFNSDGGISNYLSENYYNNNEKDTINSNNLYGNLNSAFFTFKSTRKNESLLQLTLNLAGQFNNSVKKPITNYYFPNSHTSYSNELIVLTYANKSYNPKKQFFSYGITSWLNYSSERNNTLNINDLDYTSVSDSFSSYISPYIGIGVGRIETVTDARQAIYILDDLSKKGVLTRQLSNDEIFKFSQQISKVKNKRFLDARLHKIDEISAIDSFLVSNQLLAKSDASYFTTLYDNWENSANFERKSGHVLEIRLSPSVNWGNYKNQTDILNGSSTWDKLKNNNYGINLAFNYNCARQMNQNWENITNVTLQSVLSKSAIIFSTQPYNETTLEQNNVAIVFNGNYSIGYYPSTRTHLFATLSQNFLQKFNDLISENSWYNNFYSTTNLNFSAVYYLSPQLNLSGNVGIYNNYEKYTYAGTTYNYNKIGTDFSASVRYSFF